MKRTRLRTSSITSTHRLELKADRLWSVAIKVLCGFRCQKKGCRKHADHSHHLITRGNKVLRHEWTNGIGLCAFHHDWAHNEPGVFKGWLIDTHPGMAGIFNRRYELLAIPYEEHLKQKIVQLEGMLKGKIKL